MYKGKNPAAKRSQDLITKSFLFLLESNPIDKINVKQIMNQSDLARQTFYQLFHTKDEILEYCLEEAFAKYVQNKLSCKVTNLCDAALLFFKFFDQNQKLITLLKDNDRIYLLEKKCQIFLQKWDALEFPKEDVRNDYERKLAISYSVCGMIGLYISYLNGLPQNPNRLTAEDLAFLVCRLTNSSADIPPALNC